MTKTYETISLMIVFGMFIIALLSLIITIIRII